MDPIIEQIFEGVEGLGADFKTKTAVIFEAAVTEKAKQIAEAEVARISTEFDEKLATAITKSTDNTVKTVDEFLDAVILEWATENAVNIDSSIKVQIAEKFIGDLKSLFEYHQVALPEPDSTKLVESLQTEVTAAKAELTEATAALKEAEDKLLDIELSAIFEEATKGLADTQRDRVKSLSESLGRTDVESYKQKLGILVEAFSTTKPSAKEPTPLVTESVVVPTAHVAKPTSSLIERTLALKH